MPKDRDDRRSQPGSSGMPVLTILGIGLGIPALLLVCCGCPVAGWWMLPGPGGAGPIVENPNRDANPKPQPKPQPKPPDPEAFVPKALGQPPLPGELAALKSVDLIPLIDVDQDRIHGRWAIANNVLHCNDQHLVPRIQIPYQPPAEYDFVVTFSQPSLRNGISLVMPNPHGGTFFWFIGSGKGSQYGFAGKPNREGRANGLIKANTHHTTIVEVRRNIVRARLDGKELLAFQTDFRDLTTDPWRSVKDARMLAVCCDDPTVFHHVRLIEMTGKGNRLR